MCKQLNCTDYFCINFEGLYEHTSVTSKFDTRTHNHVYLILPFKLESILFKANAFYYKSYKKLASPSTVTNAFTSKNKWLMQKYLNVVVGSIVPR